MLRVRPPLAARRTSSLEVAPSTGIDHLGVAPADVLDRARDRAPDERKAQACTRAWRSRTATPIGPPTRAGRRGARSVIVGARPYLAAEGPRPPGAAGASRYAWTDHYAPLRDGLRAIARRLRRAGHRAVVFADDNSIVDREVAYLAGLGWFGKNANILIPGAGSWFVLGCVVTTAGTGRRAAGRRMRVVPALPRRLPDRCDHRARCRRRQPLPRLAGSEAGHVPAEYREALGDRFYGCDDCQEVCPPSVRLGRRTASPSTRTIAQAWVDVLDVLDADDEC